MGAWENGCGEEPLTAGMFKAGQLSGASLGLESVPHHGPWSLTVLGAQRRV